MNKLEYLNKLETILRREHLSKAEIDDIIRDYAEFFEEGRRQGQSDGEICAKLGSPELVAQQILEEDGHNVALAPTTPRSGPRFDFKMPHFNFSWPHWERAPRAEKEPQEPREPRAPRTYRRRSGSGLGRLMSFLLKALVLCFVVPCCAAVIFGVACGLGGLLLALLAAFVAVIVGFFAASFCSPFLGATPIIFLLCLCICLLGLIVCLGALSLMALGACIKGSWHLAKSFLAWLFRSWQQEPLEQPVYARPYESGDPKEEENHD